MPECPLPQRKLGEIDVQGLCLCGVSFRAQQFTCRGAGPYVCSTILFKLHAQNRTKVSKCSRKFRTFALKIFGTLRNEDAPLLNTRLYHTKCIYGFQSCIYLVSLVYSERLEVRILFRSIIVTSPYRPDRLWGPSNGQKQIFRLRGRRRP
jgi:hypothetical protein